MRLRYCFTRLTDEYFPFLRPFCKSSRVVSSSSNGLTESRFNSLGVFELLAERTVGWAMEPAPAMVASFRKVRRRIAGKQLHRSRKVFVTELTRLMRPNRTHGPKLSQTYGRGKSG